MTNAAPTDAQPNAPHHHLGHVPFYLRVRRAMQTEAPRVFQVLEVRAHLVTVLDGTRTEVLWTHAPAAEMLAEGLNHGDVWLPRYGSDIVLWKGYPLSLVDQALASPCPRPGGCGHFQVIAAHTGRPWELANAVGQSPQ